MEPLVRIPEDLRIRQNGENSNLATIYVHEMKDKRPE